MAVDAFAADTTGSVRRRSKPLRLFLDAGATFGIHSTDFFRDYKYYLRGPSSTFNVPETVRFGMSSYQLPNIGFGVTSGYHRAVVRETYDFMPGIADSALGLPRQGLTQSFTMTVIPAIITADLYPIDRQFATYVGAGAGVAAVMIQWDETTSSSQLAGARRSGERYSATHVVPAVLLRAGISLGLDRQLSMSTAAAIHVEVSYTYVPVTAPIFERFGDQIPAAASDLRGDYRLQAGGLGLHVGMSFFLR